MIDFWHNLHLFLYCLRWEAGLAKDDLLAALSKEKNSYEKYIQHFNFIHSYENYNFS